MKRASQVRVQVIFAAALAFALPRGNAQTADTAFQQSFKVDVAESSAFSFSTFDVPVGKRLVIRYCTVTSTVPSGAKLVASIQTTVKGIAADFPQLFSSQGNGDGTDELVSNQPAVIQADGGTTVFLQIFRRSPRGAIRVIFTVSGDLIPF